MSTIAHRKLRIYVIGAGRIAAAVTRAVHARGADVQQLANYLGPVATPEALALFNKSVPSIINCEQPPSAVILAAGAPLYLGFAPNARNLTEHLMLTETVARSCAVAHVPLLFVSSWLVFNGCAGPVNEASSPQPRTAYASLKFLAECIVKEVASGTIIRSATVVDNEDPPVRNPTVLHRFIGLALRGEPLVVHADDHAAFIHRVDLAEFIARIACVDPEAHSGIYHAVAWSGTIAQLALAVHSHVTGALQEVVPVSYDRAVRPLFRSYSAAPMLVITRSLEAIISEIMRSRGREA